MGSLRALLRLKARTSGADASGEWTPVTLPPAGDSLITWHGSIPPGEEFDEKATREMLDGIARERGIGQKNHAGADVRPLKP